MQIGLLTTSYPRHPHDLAGQFVAQSAHWLTDQGDAVEVLAPAPAADSHPGVDLRPLRYALRPRLLYRAGAPDNLGHPAAWLQVPPFVGRLAWECLQRSKGWDRIISHWLLPCGMVASLAARSVPHLALAHSSDVHLLCRLPGSALWLDLLARPRTALVLTSEALRPKLASACRSTRAEELVRSARVIRMGIPGELLSPATEAGQRLRQEHGLGDEHTLVLFVGRLVPVKGVDLLVRACARLERATLVVVGEGPRKAALKKLARQAGTRALFVGSCLGRDRDAWLAAADVLALPSCLLPDGRTDSAPLVLLEAMAAGLPVVASDLGGNAELIRHQHNGLLVPPHDVAALERALARLAGHPGLCQRLGQAGAHTAAAHTWDRVGPKLRKILLEL